MKEQFCSHCGERLAEGSVSCPNCGNKVKKGMPTAVIIILVVVIGGVVILPILGIFAAIFIPNFLRARAMGQYKGCQANCKKIATAIEMYAVDHNGKYPSKLRDITPKYLASIPKCPSADLDTYSSSYIQNEMSHYYKFYCKGQYHRTLSKSNYPQYNSKEGLLTGRKSRYSSYRRSRKYRTNKKYSRNFISCQSNCRNISQALEMYSIDHKGHYPNRMAKIVPDYIRQIPYCPSAGEDTYSPSYKASKSPDNCTFFCSGENHQEDGVPLNYPQFSSVKGVVTGP